MRTVVLFPTAGEAEAFRRRCPGVAYRITGVGPAAAAAATARAIVDERPDLLLLAGKGHEDYQIIQNKTIPFDEREIVTEILKSGRIPWKNCHCEK